MKTRRPWYRYGAALLTVLALLLMMTACGSSSSSPQQENDPAAGDGTFSVWFVNIAATRLSEISYQPEPADAVRTAWELYSAMTDSSHGENVPAVPSGLELTAVEQEDRTLKMTFTGPFYDMGGNNQLLCVAALTKTMTQIDGITYLSVVMNGEPLKDLSGAEYGPLRAGSFSDSLADSLANYTETELVLYFSNADSTKLVRTTMDVASHTGTTLERTIVEQLIRGPQSGSGSVKATLPPSEKLLSINITDRICYVNLSEDFLADTTQSAGNLLAVYSIVNSLTELQTIDKVQILFDGKVSSGNPGESISLDIPLERNMELVEE